MIVNALEARKMPRVAAASATADNAGLSLGAVLAQAVLRDRRFVRRRPSQPLRLSGPATRCARCAGGRQGWRSRKLRDGEQLSAEDFADEDLDAAPVDEAAAAAAAEKLRDVWAESDAKEKQRKREAAEQRQARAAPRAAPDTGGAR